MKNMWVSIIHNEHVEPVDASLVVALQGITNVGMSLRLAWT